MTTQEQQLEDLRTDTAHVAAYLNALHDAVPGVVPDGLLALLDGAAANPASLAVLAAALRAGQAQGVPNGRMREVAGRR